MWTAQVRVTPVQVFPRSHRSRVRRALKKTRLSELRALGAKGDKATFIGGQTRTLDQIDAVGDRGKNRIKAFADGFGFTGKIDDQ